MNPRFEYLRRETLISMAINTILNVAFVVLVFGHESQIPALLGSPIGGLGYTVGDRKGTRQVTL